MVTEPDGWLSVRIVVSGGAGFVGVPTARLLVGALRPGNVTPRRDLVWVGAAARAVFLSAGVAFPDDRLYALVEAQGLG